MTHIILILIYLSFISLGLPDAILGAAWPNMVVDIKASIADAGLIYVIISIGTVFSSLFSERLSRIFKPGVITAFSTLCTAISLFGFAASDSLIELCLWAIPYGFGAGCVDACLNNYVALHYAGRHMIWLHCMWGIGASVGPYIMGFVLSNKGHWPMGYQMVGVIQFLLAVILLLTLSLWKKEDYKFAQNEKRLGFKEILKIKGVKAILVAFFAYCALEQTAGLWASSYLHLHKGIDVDLAAYFGSMFYVGITIGRAINGFMTFRLSDTDLIKLGEGIILVGIILMCLPFGYYVSLIGLILIGLGCAPIYPCIIHLTPSVFSAKYSQAIIGLEMASAYIGCVLMPPLFGQIAEYLSITLLPLYLFILLIVLYKMFQKTISS